MPPMVNAQLRTVAARASTDPFEDSSADPTPVFDGSVDAWYDETTRRVSGISSAGAALTDVLVTRTLLLDPLPVDIKIGQVVTFERDGFPGQVTGTIQAIEAPRHPHVPEDLNTVQLTLEIA